MIVHIISESAFINPLVRLIDHYFDTDEHQIMVLAFGNDIQFGIDYSAANVFKIKKQAKDFYNLFRTIKRSDKIIIHGMFSVSVMMLIILAGVSRKTICAMWGGDFYNIESSGKIRVGLEGVILRRCKAITCEMPTDYEVIKRTFHTDKPYIECKLYYSISEDIMLSANTEKIPIKILVGNSATKSNRHHEVFEVLKSFKTKLKLIIPLSYGDSEYADIVSEESRALFGENAIILRDFMPKNEYLSILETIDVAIFNHKRQQALGNIFALIAQGKKVYLDSNVSTFKYLIAQGIKVYDVSTLADTLFVKMLDSDRERNRQIILDICSEERLVKSWQEIFNA